MHNWDSIECAGEKNLKGWHLSTEAKWKICGTVLHKSDWESQGYSSERHKFESGRAHKHVVASVVLSVREIMQWWRGFYSNTVSFALKLKAFYQQLQIQLDLILFGLENSPLSCIHFPARNLTSPQYIHYLPAVLHIFSTWKFSLKSDLSLCSLEFQIILPSSDSKKYLGQNPFAIKPWFGLVTVNLASFWSVNYLLLLVFTHWFLTVYTLEPHMAAFLLLILQSLSAAIKLTYSLLSQLISMSLASCLRSSGLN